MFRANLILRAFSDISPHLKAINNAGINSRNLIFNPTFLLFNLVFPNFMKLHSRWRNHQTLILGNLESVLMELYAHSQV